MEEKFGRGLREGAPVLVRPRVPDRVLPAPSGREVRRVLRRQHLPADHQGARLFRPGAGHRRRPQAARLAPAQLPLPGRRLHHRLALFAVALARNRPGAGRQRPRGRLRGDRRAARPRRVPARRSALLVASERLLRSYCRNQGAAMSAGYQPSAAAAAGRADFATLAPGSRRARGCSTWAAATAACSPTSRASGRRRGYGIEIDDAGVLACVRQRGQRAAERPRVGPRRVSPTRRSTT